MSDPWQHRSVNMFCKTCMWYVQKLAPEIRAAQREVESQMREDAAMIGFKPAIGRCRRHAPTMSGYPVVYENDWCGDHKLDETK